MPRRCRGIRGDVGIAPYERARGAVVKRWAMHPKGTCSASLHCVGIAPYGEAQGVFADNADNIGNQHKST